MGGLDDTAHKDRPLTGGRIHLAREPAIRLGALVIEPALRRVAHDDGREEIVEPRVMQVLVALLRTAGGILTRDDLLASCWHGVVVGEDAITRVLSRLRRLADGIGDGQFKLETLTKVGYRLVITLHLGEAGPEDTALPTTTSAPEPVLAVLAFDNLCDGADMAWFSDGVSEEILQTVARGSQLKVIGRGSSFQFRGAEKAAARVAAALKATHVLDGSVRRSGTVLRIAAHLVECAHETILWSGRFERDLSDVFALQDEIAGAVAEALETTFAGDAPAGVIDPVAYDLYLKARASPFDIVGLEEAVRLDPGFAAAWAALAYHRARCVREAIGEVTRAQAIEAAETALGLGGGVGFAHAALCDLQPWGAYEAREVLLEKALAAGPRDPLTLYVLGRFLPTVGRIADASRYLWECLKLDPLYGPSAHNYAMMVGFSGRYTESQQLYVSFRRKWPDWVFMWTVPLQHAAFSGDWPEFDRLRGLVQESGLDSIFISQALTQGALLRDPTDRRRGRLLETMGERIQTTGTIDFGFLTLACGMGLVDETYRLIERASFAHLFDEDGPPPAAELNTGVIFDRLASRALMDDVRFVGFCAKIGLCDYWVKTGRWPDCVAQVPYDFKAAACALSRVQ
jgi:adenylate cyclase